MATKSVLYFIASAARFVAYLAGSKDKIRYRDCEGSKTCLENPYGLAVVKDGSLLVTYNRNSSLCRIMSDGTVSTVL